MSTFLTCFLNEASVTELFMCLLSLDHITGPIYLMLCFPYVLVLILGIIKLSEFLRLYLRLLKLKISDM